MSHQHDMLEPRPEPEQSKVYWAECETCPWIGEDCTKSEEVPGECPDCGEMVLEFHYYP